MSNEYNTIMNNFKMRKRELYFNSDLLDKLSIDEREEVENLIINYTKKGAYDTLKYLPYLKTVNVINSLKPFID